MTYLVAVVALVLGIALSGFFSGAETGLYRINRLRLHLAVQNRDRTALRLSGVLRDAQGALSVTLLGTNIMNYIATSAAAFLLGGLLDLGETDTEVYTVLALTPIIFVFGEVVPKNLFRQHADVLMTRGARLLQIADGIFRLVGAGRLLKVLTRLVSRLAGADVDPTGVADPRERVAKLLRDALAERRFGERQSDLIDRVLQLSETPVHSVMIPRNRVSTISARADRRELVRIARRTPHRHLPAFQESPHRIIGLAPVDELLATEDWSTVGERLTRAATLGPHESVATAIGTIPPGSPEFAVVVDGTGQMLGIVTLTDLVAEVLREAEGSD